MLRIIPFEIEINKFWLPDGMFTISILHFDWLDGDAYLFHIGIDKMRAIYNEVFLFDILFIGYFSRLISDKLGR